jgi:hypothetical protein
MNLACRIARLEKALGDRNAPKRVVISTASDRHESAWHGSDSLWLSIPFPGYPRPSGWTLRGALTDEQRALIGPHDTVRGLLVPPGRRRRDPDTGRQAAEPRPQKASRLGASASTAVQSSRGRKRRKATTPCPM